MKIEVDQSGKVEKTSQHTIVADSLGNCVLLKAKDKQNLLQVYRTVYKPQVFVYKTFSYCVASVISLSFKPSHRYVIDNEYFGHDEVLKGMIMKYLAYRNILIYPDSIQFAHIGKHSQAHQVAYETYKGKRKAKNVSLKDLVDAIYT
jgi:hypothetical protein